MKISKREGSAEGLTEIGNLRTSLVRKRKHPTPFPLFHPFFRPYCDDPLETWKLKLTLTLRKESSGHNFGTTKLEEFLGYREVLEYLSDPHPFEEVRLRV